MVLVVQNTARSVIGITSLASEPPSLLFVLVDSAQSIPQGDNHATPKNHHRQHRPGRRGRRRRRRHRRRGDQLARQQHARLPASTPRRRCAPRRRRSGARPRPSWSTARACRCTTTGPTRATRSLVTGELAALWPPLTSRVTGRRRADRQARRGHGRPRRPGRLQRPPAVHLRRRSRRPGDRPGSPGLLRGHPRPRPDHRVSTAGSSTTAGTAPAAPSGDPYGY